MDFDPQSNLTTCFGAEDVDVTIGELMMNVIEDEDLPECEEYIWERNGVDFIPSSIGLSAVEAKLRLEMGTVIIFHKHKASHPYHQHGRANTLRQAVRSIRGHDRWQKNGRKIN